MSQCYVVSILPGMYYAPSSLQTLILLYFRGIFDYISLNIIFFLQGNKYI